MDSNQSVTKDFKLNNIRQFIESISERFGNRYYMFAGRPIAEAGSSDEVEDTADNSIEYLRTKSYDEMTFAKLIGSDDVSPLIRRYDWTPNTVYDMFDSADTNLAEKKFYVLTIEGETYYVFICLNNNGGATSVSQPIFTSADDEYYETSDGYVWKYMYQLTKAEMQKFATLEYIPTVPDTAVKAAAVKGAIDAIKIEKPGVNYNNYASGTFFPDDIQVGGIPNVYVLSGSGISEVSGFYDGCYIKIISGIGVGQYRKIQSYTASTRQIVLEQPFATQPELSRYEISPAITIKGDGRQTKDALARAIIDPNSSNSVIKIDILDRGAGYFKATATVDFDDSAHTSGTNNVNDAELRPIIPPRLGHGYDIESQLYADKLGISVTFDKDELGEIPATNDYRTVGILKDPLFDAVKLTSSTNNGQLFNDLETVYQLDLTRFYGSVAFSTDSTTVTQVGSLLGMAVENAGEIDNIPNTYRVRVANVVQDGLADLEGTNGDTGPVQNPLTVIQYGQGISNSDVLDVWIESQSGDDIKYANSFVVTNNYIEILDPGSSYSATDIIRFSSNLNGNIEANATITINNVGVGNVDTVIMTNSGKDFYTNEIAYINVTANGAGYANAVTAWGGNNQLDIILSNPHSYTQIDPGATVEVTGYANIVFANTGFPDGSIIFIEDDSSNIIAKGEIILSQNTPTASNVEIYSAANLVALAYGPSYTNYKITLANTFTTNTTFSQIHFTDTSQITGVTITSRGGNFSANADFTTLEVNAAAGGSGATFSGGLRAAGLTYEFLQSDGVTPASGMKVNSVSLVQAGTANVFADTDLLVIPNPDVAAANAEGTVQLVQSLSANIVFAANTIAIVNDLSFNVYDFEGTELATITVTDDTNAGSTGEISVAINGELTENASYANNTVTPADSFYIANITETSSVASPNTVSGFTITDNGYDFSSQDALTPYVTNPAGGYIRLLNTSVVKEFTLTEAAPNFKIDSVSDGTSGSTGYNSNGISSVEILNPGKGYNSEAGGTANNITVSDGSSAVLYFSNNSVGEITSVQVYTSGTGYLTTSTLTVDSTGGGAGASFRINLGGDLVISTTEPGASGAVITFANDVSGVIQSYSVDDPGFGYTIAPSLGYRPTYTGGTQDTPTAPTTPASAVLTGESIVFNAGTDSIYAFVDPYVDTINATATLTLNGTDLDTFTVTHAGEDLTDNNKFVIVANSTYGDITHISFNGDTDVGIVKGINVSNNGGSPFQNYYSESDDTVFIAPAGNVTTTFAKLSNVALDYAQANITLSSGQLSAITVLNTGKNIPAPDDVFMYAAGSGGSNIRYFNDTIVHEVDIEDGGENYSNTDYVIITNRDGSEDVAANLTITTDANGTIVSASGFTNHGKGIDASFVEAVYVIDPGTSTTSNGTSVTFSPPGTISATAVAVTNSTGYVTSIVVTNPGSNFDCTPTATIAGLSDASFDVDITTPYKIRIYDTNNNFSDGTNARLNPVIRQAPELDVNVVYASVVDANTVVTPEVTINLVESADILFTVQKTPFITLDLTNFPVSFTSALEVGEYLFLQNDITSDYVKIASITDSVTLELEEAPSFTSTSGAYSRARVNATAEVSERGSNYIVVTNANGFFNSAREVFGLTSKQSLTIDTPGISFNEIPKIGDRVNPMVAYNVASGNPNLLIEDEKLIAVTPTAGGNGYAYFHSTADIASNTWIYTVNGEEDIFFSGQVYQGEESGQEITLATGAGYKYNGDFVRGSGDILYFQHILPVSRTSEQSETIKLIVEF